MSRKGVFHHRVWISRGSLNPSLTFLRNHREAIAAMDFFTVPTLTFGVLHCFSVIGHDRRKILYFNVTRNPQALWVVQQLREAWSYKQPNRFLLFDRDTKFGAEVVSAVRDMGSEPTRTSFRSPWQNGVAERWAGSCRRDLLDHVIILNERHLKRLLSSYLLYYHEDRTHLGLAKDAPAGRPTAICSKAERKILPETRRAAPSLCSGSVDSRANLLKTKLIFLKSGQGTVHVLCEYFSPVDESACNPKPKGFRQAGRKPFNVGHNGLANYS